MTTSQIKTVNKINESIEHGDIKVIAEKSGKSREYVGRVLNPFNASYDDEVVAQAILIVAHREQGRKKMLKRLTA